MTEAGKQKEKGRKLPGSRGGSGGGLPGTGPAAGESRLQGTWGVVISPQNKQCPHSLPTTQQSPSHTEELCCFNLTMTFKLLANPPRPSLLGSSEAIHKQPEIHLPPLPPNPQPSFVGPLTLLPASMLLLRI